MTTPLELFASFVPKMIVKRFSEDAAPPAEAASCFFPAAVFFADVAGFTGITERIGREGPVGVEKLTDLLNDYFGRIIDLVDSHGGDVIKFAGDAIIAIWRAEPDSEGLREATLRAAACGLAIQESLRGYQADGTQLSQRITISCGDVRSLELGGIFDRWEWLVGGKPVEQMAELDERAAVGRVSLSAEAWSLVADDSQGEVLPGGYGMLTGVQRPAAPWKQADTPLKPAMERGLRAFIPGAILSRMAAGHSDWLGELRQVSILFVNLPTLNHDTPLEVIQTAMQTLQTATYDHEGSINKLSVDDKGTSLVSAFGLPPLTHEDDPFRAVQTALAMHTALAALGLKASIGVATGRVFCGPVGNKKRREYTVMGDKVNLTARLMQAADGGILCDPATVQQADDRCEFEALPAIHVKGKEHALEIFRPLSASASETAETSPLVGRQHEVTVVREMIETFRAQAASAVMTVCGIGDIGKSRLLEEIANMARSAGMQVLSGGGDALEETSPYHAWRSVLSQIVQFQRVADDPAAHRQAILDYLGDDPNLAARASLLNAVLPLDFPEDETVRQMEGMVRAANTQELFVQLLQRAAADTPTICLMDDAQWFDSGSWAVAGLAVRRIPRLLFVVATRPPAEPPPLEYQQLRNRPDLHQLDLGPLERDEINRLLCEELEVAELPNIVAAFINDRVEGQPFFAQQLAYALRDTNLIRCTDGHCELNCEPAELERLDFPNALTGVITSRLDRLMPQQQMTAKAASVIGRAFPFHLLKEIYPFDDDRDRLLEFLRVLQENEIVHLSDPSSSRVYQFTYGMIQQVAYNLMLFGQRRKLHQAVASFYESQPGDPSAASYPLLAHHWDKAGVESKSLEYLERAADNALRIGSYKEAKAFLEQMLSRLEMKPSKGPEPHHSVLQRKLGQAHLGMGELLISRGNFYRALELAGRPAPSGQFATLVSVAVQALSQLRHRLWRRKPKQPSGDVIDSKILGDSPLHAELIRNYEHLAEVHYFANNTLGFLHAVLRSLNVAEDFSARTELARAYANMGVTVGAMRLHSVAESYLKRAEETARTVDHLPTQSWVHLVTGIYCNGVGDWNRSRESLDNSLTIARQLGDDRQVGVLLTLRGATYYYQSNFETAVEHWSEVLALGQRRNDALQEAWGYGGLAMNYLRLGQLDASIENAQAASDLFLSNADSISEIATHGILAVACLRGGQSSRAEEVAEHLLQQLKELRHPNSYYLFEAYSGVAEVFLQRWQEDAENRSSDRSKTLAMAKRALKQMATYARVFTIGRARHFVWQGKLQLLQSRPRKAIRSWNKSLDWSQRLDMPYETALARLELGRCTSVPNAERLAHLQGAAELFSSCHARFDYETAKAAMANLPSSNGT